MWRERTILYAQQQLPQVNSSGAERIDPVPEGSSMFVNVM